jgi:hypothetical protein
MIPDAEVETAQQEARESLIAKLDDLPEFQALRDVLAEAEDEWLRRASASFLKSGKAADQRKIDYTRGFFRGAEHYLTQRVKAAREYVEKKEQRS